MPKLIRRTIRKGGGAALIAALQVIALILIGFFSFIGGPQQSLKAPAETQVTGPAQDQTQTAQPLMAADKSALRASAVVATRLYEPLATQVFNLATTRAAEAAAAHDAQGLEAPNDQSTITADREDYSPYSYVYFHGTGFQPGETVNLIVVELSAAPSSFQPWNVVADKNGGFDTSWYISSEQFRGATLQVTTTGGSSRINASAILSPLDVTAVEAATPKGMNSGGFTALTSNAVTASSGQTLLILVAAESESSGAARSITSVAGTALQTNSATQITTNGASNAFWYNNPSGGRYFYMYAWRGTASGTANGTLTATFSAKVQNALIYVIKLSNNNTPNPIGITGINADTTGTNSSPVWLLSGALTPGSSMLLFGDLTNGTNPPPTWNAISGFTLIDTAFQSEGTAPRVHRSANYVGPSASYVTG